MAVETLNINTIQGGGYVTDSLEISGKVIFQIIGTGDVLVEASLDGTNWSIQRREQLYDGVMIHQVESTSGILVRIRTQFGTLTEVTYIVVSYEGSTIEDGSVTTSKLADAAVTASKIATNAVTTAKIKNKNVTLAKMADEVITMYAQITYDTVSYSSSKTAAQLHAAYQGGTSVFCVYDGFVYPLMKSTATEVSFVRVSAETIDIIRVGSEVLRQVIDINVLRPSGITVDAERELVYGSVERSRINVTLTPEGTAQNYMFIVDGDAVKVWPDGTVYVNSVGESVVHIVPTENTSLARTIRIKVVEPYMRLVSSSSIRLVASDSIAQV